MKCSMEANISHCFADIFTSRPKAYSEKGLRQLLKLRLLKLNNYDIQKIYFDVINHKFDNNFLFNCNWNFISTKKGNFHFFQIGSVVNLFGLITLFFLDFIL